MTSAASGMEDVKPSIASLADDGGAMEARFADLLKVCLNFVIGQIVGIFFSFSARIYYFPVYFDDLLIYYAE